MNAVVALRDMGPPASNAVPALIERLADKDRSISLHSAIALGNLKRRGMAVAVVLVQCDNSALEAAHARLVAEGIRDIRHLSGEEILPDLCSQQVQRLAPYDFATPGE